MKIILDFETGFVNVIEDAYNLLFSHGFGLFVLFTCFNFHLFSFFLNCLFLHLRSSKIFGIIYFFPIINLSRLLGVSSQNLLSSSTSVWQYPFSASYIINWIASFMQARFLFLFCTFITLSTMTSKCYGNKTTVKTFFLFASFALPVSLICSTSLIRFSLLAHFLLLAISMWLNERWSGTHHWLWNQATKTNLHPHFLGLLLSLTDF